MATINKVKQILYDKQLSPSQFADEIGVQRSSISHILSGRNRPSLDIVQKIARRYPEFTYDWLLDEEVDSAMLQATTQATYRSSNVEYSKDQPISSRYLHSPTPTTTASKAMATSNRTIVPEKNVTQITHQEVESTQRSTKQVDRILIFYTDGTFKEYVPA